MKGQKKEPWRIVVAVISIAFIIYMWVEKDIVAIYSSMPKEQALPLIVTTIVVSLIKVIAITVGILFIKWIVKKLSNNK